MLNTKTPDLTFAIAAVRQASVLVRHIQAELVSPALTKDDQSPVTVADFAAQALIAKLILEAFPADPLVAEEDSAALQTPSGRATLEQVTKFVSPYLPDATNESISAWIDHGDADPAARFWTLDPIDGTKGFLRGGQYVIALALIVDGDVQIAALGCPNLTAGHIQDVDGPGSVVVAVKGQGTWFIPQDADAEMQLLHVSDIEDPAAARLLRSFEAAHTNISQLDRIVEHLGTQAEPVRLDSQAKYAILAAGHGDLLFRLISPKSPHYKEKIWDQAAGSLVVQEAGGTVTDLDGRPLDFTHGRTLAKNRGVLVSNHRLHTKALAAIKSVGA
ncbi:MAG: 3'(2'),5'-bisphosphate nucleotidase [Chloroflexi bacterium]|nr:3'(2'),5'-bisphosphate nucleotidase [Chloroflexota bacterium]